MHQSKVTSYEARWPIKYGGSNFKMADEVDLEKNEGDVSFTITALLLINLTYVLWKKLTGQLFEVDPVIAKPLKIFLVVRRARELKDLKINSQWLFVRHPYGDLYLLFVRESEDFMGFLCNSCNLSKLLYLPLEGLSESSECPFFEPDKFAYSLLTKRTTHSRHLELFCAILTHTSRD